jgi:hypothetical protein
MTQRGSSDDAMAVAAGATDDSPIFAAMLGIE